MPLPQPRPVSPANDRTVLNPKVVVTPEPTICYSGGGDILVSIEDQFLITEDGPEWQTANWL